ncbi:MAG: hypothetical protein WCR79_01680 [Fusobacterium sp.]
MINKDGIIQSALRQVGEVTSYNDNRSETYRLTDGILDEIVKNLAIRTDLKFNANTIKLSSYGRNELGETLYNLPVDFYNKLSFLGKEARLEGEFIISNEEELYLRYCRKLPLSEFPDYMEKTLVYMTSLQLAENDNAFSDRVQLLNARLEQELKRVYTMEYSPVTRKVIG